MNRLRDVAKQLADGVGREARLRLGRDGGRRRLGAAGVADPLRYFAQLGLGQRELQPVELVVKQADLVRGIGS